MGLPLWGYCDILNFQTNLNHALFSAGMMSPAQARASGRLHAAAFNANPTCGTGRTLPGYNCRCFVQFPFFKFDLEVLPSQPRPDEVSQVDFFISHSWSCPSWMKRLALCHCLNLNLAIGSCGFAFLLAILILIVPAGSVAAVAQQDPALRYVLLLLWPFLMFLGTYLFGHLLCPRRFWIDQVCVHPSDPEVKSRTLQAIPAFVAQSKQMLVIWDDTYWQRLWCNYEVAVYVKASSARPIRFVPVWMPLWVLSCFTFLTLMCFLSLGEVWSYQLDLDSRLSCMISFMMYQAPMNVVWAGCCALPSFWLCARKVQKHELMLNQMKHFDIRSTECTVESDRAVIQQQIVNLFDEALEPPLQVPFGTVPDMPDAPLVSPEVLWDIRDITSYPTRDEILDQFNTYVRGPLRESVEASTGKEDYLPLNSCIAAILPMILGGFTIAFGCDGRADCEQSASYWGYASVSQYMICNVFACGVQIPLTWILMFPLMLRSTSLVTLAMSSESSGTWQTLVGASLTGLVLAACMFSINFQYILFLLVVIKYSALCLGAYVSCFAIEFLALWFCFFRTPAQNSSRCFAVSALKAWRRRRKANICKNEIYLLKNSKISVKLHEFRVVLWQFLHIVAQLKTICWQTPCIFLGCGKTFCRNILPQQKLVGWLLMMMMTTIVSIHILYYFLYYILLYTIYNSWVTTSIKTLW